MKLRLPNIVSSSILSVALALGFVGASQASLYVGRYDPQFALSGSGSPLAGLGWQVDLTVFVPDSCDHLSGGPFLDSNSGPVSPTNCGGGAVVQSALVTLYDITNTSSTKVLDFVNGLSHPLMISQLLFDNGNLQSILTNKAGDAAFAGSFTPAGPYSQFDLQFGSPALSSTTSPNAPGNPTLEALCNTIIDSIQLSRFGDSSWNCVPGSNCTNLYSDPNIPFTRAGFARVPEPGSTALVVAALLGLGWVARNRRPIRSSYR